MIQHKLTSILLLTALLFVTVNFQCGSNSTQPSLAERAVRAVAAVPSVVRTLFPNANPDLLRAIDAAGAAFSEFSGNQTADRWTRAENAWNRAKPLLSNLQNSRINSIIAVVDILLSQVTVITPPEGSKSPAKVKAAFKKEDVEKLELLVREK